MLRADHENATRGVIGHGILYADLPVMDARVDDLEAGCDPGGCRQHVIPGDTRPLQVRLQHEGDLAFGAWLDQPCPGDRDGGPIRVLHRVGEEAEVGLVDIQHVLNRFAGHTDLLADDPLSIALASGQHVQGDVVGIVDRDLGVALGQGLQGAALAQRFVKFVAQATDQGFIHGRVRVGKQASILRFSPARRWTRRRHRLR
ncbi:hypothetical protein SDC9_187144 [bioreactor metagenome]|uniref:Uncharacterized protein n=1 Tax=bioreactor metagenome TaxID=1076179 RepID=A0A645HM44_9ZZZZ